MTRHKTRRIALFAVAAMAFSLSLATTALAKDREPSDGQIRVCHATGSEKNPYVEFIVDTDSISGVNGHGNHEGDIIPSFNASDKRDAYPGLNWDSEGQAIWNNNCEIPDETTTTTTDHDTNTTTTTTATTTTSATATTTSVETTTTESSEVLPATDTVSSSSGGTTAMALVLMLLAAVSAGLGLLLPRRSR